MRTHFETGRRIQRMKTYFEMSGVRSSLPKMFSISKNQILNANYIYKNDLSCGHPQFEMVRPIQGGSPVWIAPHRGSAGAHIDCWPLATRPSPVTKADQGVRGARQNHESAQSLGMGFVSSRRPYQHGEPNPEEMGHRGRGGRRQPVSRVVFPLPPPSVGR